MKVLIELDIPRTRARGATATQTGSDARRSAAELNADNISAALPGFDQLVEWCRTEQVAVSPIKFVYTPRDVGIDREQFITLDV